ncbi:serine/threonine kinase, partial [Aphelenchoides avenae]
MAGLIVLDMTTSLLEPIMSAKDEGQDICTTLACYEAAKKSLRRWGRSAERITTKALAMLDNEGDCDLSAFKEEYELFIYNVLEQLEGRFGGHADKLAKLENLLPLKASSVSYGTIRDAVLLCIECGTFRRSHNVVHICPAAYPSIRLLLRTYLNVISDDGDTSATNSTTTDLLQSVDLSVSKWAIAKERLTILRPVGSGVSSKVHLAEFRLGITVYTTRSVAVKSVLDAEYSVMREVGFLSECNHSNVVEFIGFYVDSVGTHIVTEFMPGGDLSKYLADEHSVSGSLWDIRNLILLQHPTIREALSLQFADRASNDLSYQEAHNSRGPGGQELL